MESFPLSFRIADYVDWQPVDLTLGVT